MESALAGKVIIAVLFYSTFFHNCKGKLAGREEAPASGNREYLEHTLAYKKESFVNGHFLI